MLKSNEEKKDDIYHVQLLDTSSNNIILNYEEVLSSTKLSSIEAYFNACWRQGHIKTILNTGDHLTIDSNGDKMLEKGTITSSEIYTAIKSYHS